MKTNEIVWLKQIMKRGRNEKEKEILIKEGLLNKIEDSQFKLYTRDRKANRRRNGSTSLPADSEDKKNKISDRKEGYGGADKVKKKVITDRRVKRGEMIKRPRISAS
jgi:hypothetical protein